jgi:HrpA-like RNA helicase
MFDASKLGQIAKGIWPDGGRRQLLPIDRALAGVFRLFEDGQKVVILEGETGSGKTIRSGQAALLCSSAHVWLTQPRRAPVRWNGAHIAHELGSVPGKVVGWRLRGEQPVESRATRLHLRVDQGFVNMIQANGRLPEGLIIVDEAHERSVTLDLLLGLIKDALPRSPGTRVLITSATIDTQKFSAYFDGAPVVSVPGRVFPVRTEVLSLARDEHHTQAAGRAAEEVLRSFLAGRLTVPAATEGGTASTVTKGTVLVLLPGKEDINSVMSCLGKAAEGLGAAERVEILACHGESTPEEQSAVQAPVPDGVLRFVCGTEVLRTGVTVRDTIGVIDSLQVKRNVVDARGVAHLAKVHVSRAEADQAKGRAGRTAPGFYIPCSFGDEYGSLAPYPQPAVLRAAITAVTLEVAAVGLSIRKFPWIDSPPAEKVEVAIRRLQRIGALGGDERITDLGKLLLQFPIDPERAKALVTADHLGVLSEAVVAVSALEAEGIFHLPKADTTSVTVDAAMARWLVALSRSEVSAEQVDLQDDDLPDWLKPVSDGAAASEEDLYAVDVTAYDFPLRNGARGVADLLRQVWAGESRSDFAAIVRAYRAFKAEEERLHQLVDEAGERLSHGDRNRRLTQWCFRNFLNLKRLRMAEAAMRQLREELAASPLKLRNSLAAEREFDAEALTKALASGLTDNVAVRSGSGYDGPLGWFSLAYASAAARTGEAFPPVVLVGGVHKIPASKRGREILLADLAAPVQPEWLAEVMPQLCTTTRLGNHRYDPARDAVVETERLCFLGLNVREVEKRSSDDAAAGRVFADWLSRQIEGPDSEGMSVLSVPLRQTIEANRALLLQARQLNARAGQAVFPAVSGWDLTNWLSERLSGARCCADLVDPAALSRLQLSKLDSELVKRVLVENPDTIEVLGLARPVEYPSPGEFRHPPRVSLPGALEGNAFMRLPDEGIRLPGGRPVEVGVRVGWETISNTDIAALKQAVRERLNQRLWEEWLSSAGAPQLAPPSAPWATAVVPQVVVAQYGVCTVTGAPIEGFGTVIAQRSYYSGTTFQSSWFRSRAEAETARSEAVAELDKLAQAERAAAELAALKEAVETAKARLDELAGHPDLSRVAVELAEVTNFRRVTRWTSGTADDLRRVLAAAKGLIARVEAAIDNRRSLDEQERQEAEAARAATEMRPRDVPKPNPMPAGVARRGPDPRVISVFAPSEGDGGAESPLAVALRAAAERKGGRQRSTGASSKPTSSAARGQPEFTPVSGSGIGADEPGERAAAALKAYFSNKERR